MIDHSLSDHETRVELPPPFSDDRGDIQPLVDRPMQSALMITSRRGSVRANHYHKTDWHYCYVVSGKMDYYWRPTGSKKSPEKIEVGPGEMFFTPPLTDHAMVFTEDTVFLTLAGNPRDQKTYEEDLVKIELVPSA